MNVLNDCDTAYKKAARFQLILRHNKLEVTMIKMWKDLNKLKYSLAMGFGDVRHLENIAKTNTELDTELIRATKLLHNTYGKYNHFKQCADNLRKKEYGK